MKSGFKNKVEYMLRRKNFINGIGRVSKNSPAMRNFLLDKGYILEDDEDVTVDFIYLSKKDSKPANIAKALTKLQLCGIIVVNIGNGEISIIKRERC